MLGGPTAAIAESSLVTGSVAAADSGAARELNGGCRGVVQAISGAAGSPAAAGR